ncbi:MAG: cation-translocating P-type ATPase [Flavitalea sp.]
MALNQYWYSKSGEETLELLSTTVNGLSEESVTERQAQYGKNILPEPKGKTLFTIFVSQFLSPLIYVLIGAAILSIVIGDLKDALFIFAIILINAILGTWQEWKAENSAAALKEMVRVKAKVYRNNNLVEVDAQELVPGDIIRLESGMKIPADGRVLESNELLTEEALLTGESMAIEKTPKLLNLDRPSIGDQVNMVFAATTVLKGRAKAVIVATGIKTELGKIAASLSESKSERPPLLQRMDSFSRNISVIVLFVCIALGVIGWLRGMPLMEILFFMVAVGVSAIPEGLPVALTVALSIGTRRMAKRNVIVRKLPAVEGLGSCTMIASDKTGTLTMDQQSVETILLSDNVRFAVTGKGYSGDGKIESDHNNGDSLERLETLISVAVLSNESQLNKSGDEWKHSGDAVDVALLSLAYKSGNDPSYYEEKFEVISLVPYESEKKFGGVFFRRGEQIYFGLKGALEIVNQYLDEKEIAVAHEQSERLAIEGYRVITIAITKVNSASMDEIKTLDVLGMVGLIDPLRPEARDAIDLCKQAGIRVAMITGDHPATALTIATQLGIATNRSEVITGKELQDIENDENFATLIKDKNVFARVAPLQKKNIVEAMKQNKNFVSVTGDGANDAPALKVAHIGIAMGSGTDLAKEAASLIVTDNNFASIAAGVEEGRYTYDNLRKIVYLLISTGAAEILMVAIPIIFGLPLPFIAVQLLWLNLVTNGIQELSLAFEEGDPLAMKKPPRDPKESIFDKLMNSQIIVSAIVMSIITILTWYWLTIQPDYNEIHARTVIMMLMVLIQNFHVLNCRSEIRSIFNLSFKKNNTVIISIILAQLVHIAASYTPGLRDILQLEPITLKEWLFLIPLASLILFAMEIYKFILRKRSGI